MREIRGNERPAAATRRVARNTGLLAGADILTKVGLLVLYAVLARSVGASTFGEFTLAISLVFLIQISSFGTDLVLTRETARELDRVHGVFWNGVAVKLGVGVPTLLIILAIALLAGIDERALITLVLLGLAGLVDAVALTAHAVLRGREQMGPPAAAVVLERGLIAVLGVAALLVLNAGLPAVGGIYLLGALVGAAYIFRALRRHGIRPAFGVRGEQLRELLRSAVPLGIVSVFAIALARIDAVILALLEDSEIVGLYGAAYRLFEAPLFLVTAFAAAILPVLSRLTRSSTPSLARVFDVSWMAVSAATAALGGLLLLFPSVLIETVYGQEFSRAEAATQLLGAGLIVYPTAALCMQTLTAQDRERQLAVVMGSAVAVNVGLNFALIPYLSLDGAALAMAISLLGTSLLLLSLVVRLVGPISPLRALGAVALALLAMALISTVLEQEPLSALVALGVYATVFFAVEALLHRGDLGQLLRAARSGGAPEGSLEADPP